VTTHCVRLDAALLHYYVVFRDSFFKREMCVED